MIKITNEPNLTEKEIIRVVQHVIKKGKFSGAFQSETFFKIPPDTLKVVSWNDGAQTDYFHVTKIN